MLNKSSKRILVAKTSNLILKRALFKNGDLTDRIGFQIKGLIEYQFDSRRWFQTPIYFFIRHRIQFKKKFGQIPVGSKNELANSILSKQDVESDEITERITQNKFKSLSSVLFIHFD